MKKQNRFLIICITIILSLCFIFSSCGLGLSDSKEIEDITATELTDGSIEITISYTDDYYEPLVFTIPKGEAGAPGERGSGISSAKVETDNVTGERTLIITFDSPSIPNLNIPLIDGIDGEDGKGIESISRRVNLDGSVSIVVNYTDGTSSQAIALPSGKDGDSISIDYSRNQDGTVTLYIQVTHDDGSIDETSFTLPKGDQGNGISYIESKTEGTQFILTIYYENGLSEAVSFDRPNTWLYGTYIPSDELGVDGDFYFDTVNFVIYLKEDGTWNDYVYLNQEKKTFKVTFYLQFEYEDEVYDVTIGPAANKYVYNIQYGTFASNGYTDSMPYADLDGFNFLGWYSTRNPNFAVNAPFTDMTLVSSDITLYPVFEKIN